MKTFNEKFDDDKFNYIKSVKLKTGISWKHFIFIITVFFDKYHDKIPVEITPDIEKLLEKENIEVKEK